MSNICEKCPAAKTCPDANLPKQDNKPDQNQQTTQTIVQAMAGLWNNLGMCGARDSHG